MMDTVIIANAYGERFVVSKSLIDCLKERQPFLPTCQHYKELLDLIHMNTGESYDKLREEYCDYTYEMHAEFFRFFDG